MQAFILLVLLVSVLSVQCFFSDNAMFESLMEPEELDEPSAPLAMVAYPNYETNGLPLCRNGGKCSSACHCPGRCLVGRFNLSRRTCLL